VGPFFDFHGVDERCRARRGGSKRVRGRRHRCDRGPHAQRQGRRRRGPTPIAVRGDAFAHRVPVRSSLWGLGGALMHPVSHVCTELSGSLLPRSGPQSAGVVPRDAVTRRGPTAGKPRRAVRVRERQIRLRLYRGSRREGAGPPACPRMDEVYLRAAPPRALLQLA